MRRSSLLLPLLLAACGDAEIATLDERPSLAGLEDKVVRGDLTDERPEVGSISMGCTATLVAPEVAITAAHCVNFGTRNNPGNYGSMTFESGRGDRSYVVERYVSFSNGDLGANDIALLRLAQPVPSEVASPAPIARATPPDGTTLTVYGYGCTRRGTGTDWQKRKASFTEGADTNHLCPGDSGGPVFDESTGAVLRINSGYWHDGFGTDIFGHVPTLYDRLRPQIDAWTESALPEPGGDGPSPEVDREDPQSEQDLLCGFDRRVRQLWICSEHGGRYRCPKGKVPQREACEAGCVSGQPGEDARCGQVGEPEPRPCGAEYAPYVEWTCTSDGFHMLRCHNDLLEIERCGGQCLDGGPGAPDRCP